VKLSGADLLHINSYTLFHVQHMCYICKKSIVINIKENKYIIYLNYTCFLSIISSSTVKHIQSIYAHDYPFSLPITKMRQKIPEACGSIGSSHNHWLSAARCTAEHYIVRDANWRRILCAVGYSPTDSPFEGQGDRGAGSDECEFCASE